MKKVLITTACTAALVAAWSLYTIQPPTPLLTPQLYEISLPEATVRVVTPIDFDLVLPEVVIRSGSVKKA